MKRVIDSRRPYPFATVITIYRAMSPFASGCRGFSMTRPCGARSPTLTDRIRHARVAPAIAAAFFALCISGAQAQAPAAGDSTAGDSAASDSAASDSATASSRGWWISLGGGRGSQGPAGNTTLTFRVDHHLITLLVAGTDDGTFFGPSEAVRDFAFLYGQRVSSTPDWLFVSGSIGLSLVGADASGYVGGGSCSRCFLSLGATMRPGPRPRSACRFRCGWQPSPYFS